MIWIIASMPLWVFGGLLFVLGSFAIWRIAFNESDTPVFKTSSGATDGQAMMFGLVMIIVSSAPLYLAARMVS